MFVELDTWAEGERPFMKIQQQTEMTDLIHLALSWNKTFIRRDGTLMAITSRNKCTNRETNPPILNVSVMKGQEYYLESLEPSGG